MIMTPRVKNFNNRKKIKNYSCSNANLFIIHICKHNSIYSSILVNPTTKYLYFHRKIILDPPTDASTPRNYFKHYGDTKKKTTRGST
jgi:hypothetical protein